MGMGGRGEGRRRGRGRLPGARRWGWVGDGSLAGRRGQTRDEFDGLVYDSAGRMDGSNDDGHMRPSIELAEVSGLAACSRDSNEAGQ